MSGTMKLNPTIREFLKRNRRYAKEGPIRDMKKYLDMRKTAVEEQRPKMGVLACSDSRVPVEDIFIAYPGEIFVIRNAGNLIRGVKPSVEYALRLPSVDTFLVLAHTDCGAMKAGNALMNLDHVDNTTEAIGLVTYDALVEAKHSLKMGSSFNALIREGAIRNAYRNYMEVLNVWGKLKGEVQKDVSIYVGIYFLSRGDVFLIRREEGNYNLYNENGEKVDIFADV